MEYGTDGIPTKGDGSDAMVAELTRGEEERESVVGDGMLGRIAQGI